MEKLKLAHLKVAEYVMDKPVGIRDDGRLIFPKELMDKSVAPTFGLSMKSKDNKTKLALARFKAEPDFEFGILNKAGRYSKEMVLKNIEEQTTLGMELTEIEMRYTEFFANELLGNVRLNLHKPVSEIPVLPELPESWNDFPRTYWRYLNTKVLFCENTTNNVTTPAANYRIANVHPVFAARGFEVISLEGVNNIRSSYVPYAKDSKVVYIGGIGHGGYNVFTGDNYNHILEAGAYNPAEVKGKIAHFLSCETARDLGPDTVTNGALAYTGYTEDFVFDWANADLYWQCDSQFDISMAHGKTVEQAIADTIAQYDAAIASVAGTSTASTLFNDRNLLRSPVSGLQWGNKSARILPYVFWYMSFAEFAAR